MTIFRARRVEGLEAFLRALLEQRTDVLGASGSRHPAPRRPYRLAAPLGRPQRLPGLPAWRRRLRPAAAAAALSLSLTLGRGLR